MPTEIRRWFLDTDYATPSVEQQDWDLVLADWDFVPLLTEYAEERANPIEKRMEAFSALLVLQGSLASTPDPERKRWINREIEQVVVGDPELARRACSDWLGAVETLVVRQILGDQIPDDIPQWIHKKARTRA
jgi:hypothetical protein